jgi:hypothetical protein
MILPFSTGSDAFVASVVIGGLLGNGVSSDSAKFKTGHEIDFFLLRRPKLGLPKSCGASVSSQVFFSSIVVGGVRLYFTGESLYNDVCPKNDADKSDNDFFRVGRAVLVAVFLL